LQVNCGEVTEVLKSAAQLLEPLSPCIENFLPKVRLQGFLKAYLPKQYDASLSLDANGPCSLTESVKYMNKFTVLDIVLD
jgi:hypothetical protein